MTYYNHILSRLGPDITSVYSSYTLPCANKISQDWKKVMSDLTKGVCKMDVSFPFAVSEPGDQTRVLRELKPTNGGSDIGFYTHEYLSTLFRNADGVRVVHNMREMYCPAWFRTKYGNFIKPDEIWGIN